MGDLEQRLAAAYAAGNSEEIMHLLAARPSEAPKHCTDPSVPSSDDVPGLRSTLRGLALDPDAAEFVPTSVPPVRKTKSGTEEYDSHNVPAETPGSFSNQSLVPAQSSPVGHQSSSGSMNAQAYSNDGACWHDGTLGRDSDIHLNRLLELFPQADSSMVSALLLAHGGDAGAAALALTELSDCGALAVSNSQSPHGDRLSSMVPTQNPRLDTDAYTKAVVAFDEQFPSLGDGAAKATRADGGEGRGRSAWGLGAAAAVSVRKQHARVYEDGGVLSAAREQHLREQLPWVPASAVRAALSRAGGDATAATAALQETHPKPAGWDAQVRRVAEDAARRTAVSTAALGRDDEGEERSVGVGCVRWVASGEEVRDFYTRKRAEASVEARKRNKYFEQAAVAARERKGAEAARLGALGRAANARMKELHGEAADAIWNAKNVDPARDGQIDLHALHVAEVLERLPDALEDVAQRRTSVIVVTGTGHHTIGGKGNPRLRPAVQALLDELGYRYDDIVDSGSYQVGAFRVYLR